MSTSNFSDINTPSDLVKANQQTQQQEDTVADKLMDQIIAEDPSVGIEIAKRVMIALRDLHEHGCEQYKEEGDINAAVIWHADAVLLDRAVDLIRDIVLWYPYGKPPK